MKALSILCLALASILISCGQGNEPSQDVPVQEPAADNKTKTSPSPGKESQHKAAPFTIPKEINKDLFVVAFYEKISNANSFIVYNSEKKKEATKFMYFDDGSIGKRKLIAESETLFREIFDDFPEDKPHYKINDDSVEYLYTNGQLGYTYPILK